jgi:uncharacterized protein YodC (DUF2158 family)
MRSAIQPPMRTVDASGGSTGGPSLALVVGRRSGMVSQHWVNGDSDSRGRLFPGPADPTVSGDRQTSVRGTGDKPVMEQMARERHSTGCGPASGARWHLLQPARHQ